MHNLGHTRSVHAPTHILQSPDSFVRTVLPGMSKAEAIVHVSPALGAAFTQYSAELAAEGCLGPTDAQRFIYVLSGTITLQLAGESREIGDQGFCYLPAGSEHRVSSQSGARLAVIEKTYLPLSGVAAPESIVSREKDVQSQPLMNDPWLQVRSLLPDDPAFDFAVNTMEYRPGAGLPMVEIHVMEHGLLMLEGGGIYRLGESWYPVADGDFIWMAPYCPQWFGAIGKSPAKYLIYKNWNRSPLS